MKKILILLLIGISIFLFLPLGPASFPSNFPSSFPGNFHIPLRKTTKQLFFEELSSFASVGGGDYAAKIAIKAPSSMLKSNTLSYFLGNNLDLKFDMTGSFSKQTGQAAAAITTASPANLETQVDFTDLIVDGENIYINFRPVFNYLTSSYKMKLSYSIFFPTDYLSIKAGELGDSGLGLLPVALIVRSDCPKLQAAQARVFKVLYTSIGSECLSLKNGVFSLRLDSPSFQAAAGAVFRDINSNAGEYADAIIELQSKSPNFLSSNGLTAEKLTESRDSVIAQLKDSSARKLQGLSKLSDFSMSLSIGSAAENARSLILTAESEKENLSLAVDMTLTEKQVEKPKVPEKYMNLDDVLGKSLVRKSAL